LGQSPIIYSATRQYSLGDYAATFIGYIGLATPSFLLALIMRWPISDLTLSQVQGWPA
jgi:ABC-type dipeptide/oligopeptide/nickel transport system permease component